MSAWQEEQSKVWADIVAAARRINEVVDLLISVDSAEGTELREKMEIVKLITHAQV